MAKKIIYTDPVSGYLCVVHPAPIEHLCRVIAESEKWTADEHLEFVAGRALPENVEHHIIDDAIIPKERDFRLAWQYDAETKEIKHDIDKCVELTKQRLRSEREPLLAQLDVEMMKAQEKGNPADDIAKKKQALRDITDAPNNKMTIEELRKLSVTNI